MLVTITPNTKQVRRYAESALNGFEDLSVDNAVDNAKKELANLLAYLDGLQNADDTFCESFISGVKGRVKVELNIGNLDS